MRKPASAIIDKTLPQEEKIELYNTLKTGAIVTVISSNIKSLTETVEYENIGFEVRDTLLWLHLVEGKQELVPIILLRKPFSNSNLASNIINNETGVLNIGATRISYTEESKTLSTRSIKEREGKNSPMLSWVANENGRFPSNMIFSKTLLPVGTYYPTTKTNSKASLIKFLTKLIKPKNSTMLLITQEKEN